VVLGLTPLRYEISGGFFFHLFENHHGQRKFLLYNSNTLYIQEIKKRIGRPEKFSQTHTIFQIGDEI
jgi:hypothetical protein